MTADSQLIETTIQTAGRVFQVSIEGDDTHPGTADAPLRTISAAAELAQPGDTIEVGAGVYRERVDPPRGGTGDDDRIVYRAAQGARPVITGSEVVTGWTQEQNSTWKAAIPNNVFGDFNPFADEIKGDWYNGRGRTFHTARVYLDGEPRVEARDKEEVLEPIKGRPLWFAEVGDEETIVWAQFEGDPNQGLVEVNVRQSVFYPSRNHIDYLTVSGFEMRHAATPWAPPTAEQIGLIGTNWSKGWIIEDNRISHSRCVGITLGKHGDEFDNMSANTAEGYVVTIERAHDRGWSKETIGSHVVRRNHVSYCGQAGIVGSMGCAFSTVTGNEIHDIHLMEHFSGAEEGGIKFHAAIDMEISGNHVYRTRRGIWLDWMAQGASVTGNLLHDNVSEDIYLEVNHGPHLVASNILLSHRGLKVESTGGAFVHNLVTGMMSQSGGHGRQTPYLEPHGTEVTCLGPVHIGDDRWYNNLLLGPIDMQPYDWASAPVVSEGNVYGALAIPPTCDKTPHYITQAFATPVLVREVDGWYLAIDLPADAAPAADLVTSERLGAIQQPRFGRPAMPAPAFEAPNGTSFTIDTDYFGKGRSADSLRAGPFSDPMETTKLKVWPVD
ncbi:right-handed parallel beta-helix repeat-containing protein [Sphingomonas sp.]|uniref:right-handed parallel beta-helix repeat-containing protein n=1 Tax=Sphingomonas sp. TaxID=28214 RepID=UPI0025DF9406|nr:right-handed parallel beta-helix repeat-containing protein [Sphingomonas sp.]